MIIYLSGAQAMKVLQAIMKQCTAICKQALTLHGVSNHWFSECVLLFVIVVAEP